MFGLDDSIASFTDGTSLLLVIAVAILLGLRHATDPDHLVAVSTLLTSKQDGSGRRAAALGLAWGLGHALTLFVFGLPIVLYRAYLPEPVQRGAETAVGVMIVGLAVWLLIRWRRGVFRTALHRHGDDAHLHAHADAHAHPPKSRSALTSFGIGLLHGMGGSAGVGILLVATIESHAYGVLALGLLALFTAVSMTMLSSGYGLALTRGAVRRSFNRLAPMVGAVSLGFGVWYSLAALGLAPYYF
jgi:ABC-type nickel/cobalt efflux system permease component RcnA